MAVTPQTNTTLSAMADEIKKYDDFAICGHVNPDGDCLGSQLALASALRSIGKRVTCLLASSNPIEAGLGFLPGIQEMVPGSQFEGDVRAFIACDVPISERMGEGARVQERAAVKFTIDHHAVPQSMSDFNYVDPDSPATGMLIWQLIKELGVTPSPEMALCCYVALMTDTGRFQYQNTTAEAFVAAGEMVAAGASPSLAAREVYQSRTSASIQLERIMLENMQVAEDGLWALSYVTLADFERTGAVKADAEPLIDTLRSLKGVKAACMLREQVDCVRGSLRAKGDELDVAELARSIGGGGHKAAAGFTFEGQLADALAVLPGRLDALCEAVR